MPESSKEVSGANVKYDSGAVRSSDAEDTRFDLISPVALCRLVAAQIELDWSYTDSEPLELLGESQWRIYQFLGGERSHFELEWALIRVLDVIHYQSTGKWWEVSPTSPDDLSCLPPYGVKAIAAACAEGAKKYADYNWERGMPVADLLNHALRHIHLYMVGDRDEDHLGHAAWNLAGAIHSHVLWPHLNRNLRLNGAWCVPPKPVDGGQVRSAAEAVDRAVLRIVSDEDLDASTD